MFERNSITFLSTFIFCFSAWAAPLTESDGPPKSAQRLPHSLTVEKPKFSDPISGKPYRLNWCHQWYQDCGEKAANAYCFTKGYEYARRFEKDSGIGNVEPTWVIGANRVCVDSTCDGFKYITCDNRPNI